MAGAGVRGLVRVFDRPDHLRFEDELRPLRRAHSEGRGWSPEVFALAIAIQNIVWGIGQPFAGAIADRYGSARILAAGGVVYGVGVALMAVSPPPAAFHLTAGVLVGLGLGGVAFERTGSFAPIWWAGIALAVAAAALHWPIVERPAPRLAVSPQPEG